MKTPQAFCCRPIGSPAKQKGIVAVVVTIGMLALLAVTGLALDSGHLLVNKTNLQNATDAAALAAARTLQITDGNETEARTAANTVFSANLTNELTNEAPTVAVTFSETLLPGSFANSVADPRYVKVETSSVALTSYLVQAVGVTSKNVSTASVAGYAQGVNVCNLIPVMVCAKEPPAIGEPGYDPDAEYFHGFKVFDPTDFNAAEDTTTLKVGSGDGPDTDVGTGSFHLLDLDGLQGANDIRYAFAGNPNCAGLGEEMELDLSPGNKVGPTVQGINTRFGLYSGPLNGQSDIYPPDTANDFINGYTPCESGDSTSCLDPVAYHDYYNDPNQPLPASLPGFERRVVGVPIAECTGDATGNDTVDIVQEPTGIGCFLLTEPASQTGGAQGDDGSGSLKGVFMEQCPLPAVGISNNSGVEIIVLYKNPDRGDA